RCLFHLELGDYPRVLALYDSDVRAESTSEYLDICNAVAMLWRLEERGVDVGNRWAELARQSAAHIDDHMLVFADAHYAMALAAGGDAPASERMLAAARSFAGTGETEAQVMAEVGLAVCEAAAAHRSGDYGRAVDLLLPARGRWARLGGSRAQRD